MKFKDDQRVIRFFRMEDNVTKVDIITLRIHAVPTGSIIYGMRGIR